MTKLHCTLSEEDNVVLNRLRVIAEMSDPLQVTHCSTIEWDVCRKFYRELGYRYKFPVHKASIKLNGEVMLDEKGDLR